MHNPLLIEECLKSICCYCGSEISQKPWESEFLADFHYKSITCNSCHKKITTKVNFLGSGHDSWDNTKVWTKQVNTKKEKIEIKTIKNLVALIK
jgi:hypothetical protein